MKTLDIYSLHNINKDLTTHFTLYFKNKWLSDNFNYIKKTFRITSNKYNHINHNFHFYQIYLLMITIIKQLFGNKIVRKKEIQIKNKKFYYFIYNILEF